MLFNILQQPKKRVTIDSDTDQSVATTKSSDSKKRKTRGRPAKQGKKTTETDLAVRGLINDLDGASNNTPRYHFTPETPVSDHGIDVTPILHHTVDATDPPRLATSSREDSVTTPISDSGVDFTPEMDYELDRLVREGPDVDLLAEAAKGIKRIE